MWNFTWNILKHDISYDVYVRMKFHIELHKKFLISREINFHIEIFISYDILHFIWEILLEIS